MRNLGQVPIDGKINTHTHTHTHTHTATFIAIQYRRFDVVILCSLHTYITGSLVLIFSILRTLQTDPVD